MDVTELGRRLNIDASELQKLPVVYHEARMPKKSGGVRVLQVPDEALKKVQRTILRRVLGRLAAHPAAMGFEKGQSIATNAAPHVGAKILLKMDLKEFFDKTSAKRVRAYFVKIGWNGATADLLVKLTTYQGALPQGAPTSPRLSNLVNYGLDARLFGMALKVGATYTRYADDMTFSIARKVQTGAVDPVQSKVPSERAVIAALIVVTKEVAKKFGYALHQDKKLQIRRRHDRMLVTGVVVNERLNLPREMRRRLRAMEHRIRTGKPATMTEAQIRGWRALESMIAAKRGT